MASNTPLRTLVLVAVVLAVVACEALLVEPAASPGASVDVEFDPVRGGVVEDSPLAGPRGVREVWLRLTTASGSRDTIVAGRFDEEVLRATAWLHPGELRGALHIEAQIRLARELVLFSGAGSVDVPTVAPTVRIAVEPAPLFAFEGEGGVVLSRFDGTGREMWPLGTSSRPDISPIDGSVLVSSSQAIRYLDPYTGGLERVIPEGEGPSNQAWGSFTADGRWIYFMGIEQGSPGWELWRVRADGSRLEPVRRLSAAEPSLEFPAVSSDGRRVAYTSGDLLRVHDLASGQSTDLGVLGSRAVWSPDDEWLAYLGSDRRLRIVRPAGSDDRSIGPDTQVRLGDWTDGGEAIVAATTGGYAFRVEISTGFVEFLPGLGSVGRLTAAP